MADPSATYSQGEDEIDRSDYFEELNPKLTLKKVVEEVDPNFRKTRIVCTLG